MLFHCNSEKKRKNIPLLFSYTNFIQISLLKHRTFIIVLLNFNSSKTYKHRNIRMRIISAIMDFSWHRVSALYMFLLVLGGFRWFCIFFGWFQVVSVGFRWFQVIPRFSKYEESYHMAIHRENQEYCTQVFRKVDNEWVYEETRGQETRGHVICMQFRSRH